MKPTEGEKGANLGNQGTQVFLSSSDRDLGCPFRPSPAPATNPDPTSLGVTYLEATLLASSAAAQPK